jgi:hypothetical protein
MDQLTGAAPGMGGDRAGVLVNLSSRFDNLSGVPAEQLDEWRCAAPEQPVAAVAALAGAPTSFGRSDPVLASALIYRGW